MKQKFSSAWTRSTQRRKQRKYRYNAPLHLKQKMVCATLSKELREKHKKRSARVKKGDKIKIVRGTFKGKTGKVDRISIKKAKVYVAGIERTKKDGTKSLYPLESSNLMVTELKTDDKMRQKALK